MLCDRNERSATINWCQQNPLKVCALTCCGRNRSSNQTAASSCLGRPSCARSWRRPSAPSSSERWILQTEASHQDQLFKGETHSEKTSYSWCTKTKHWKIFSLNSFPCRRFNERQTALQKATVLDGFHVPRMSVFASSWEHVGCVTWRKPCETLQENLQSCVHGKNVQAFDMSLGFESGSDFCFWKT